MLPSPKNYAIFPSVVLAGKATEMTILPTEKSFMLFEDQEYRLTILPVNSDDFYTTTDPQTYGHLPVVAHDGILRFNYTFEGEQEYTILLSIPNKEEYKLLFEFHIYALKEDLYALRPLKGDFHAHSYRSNGRQDPSALAGYYREYGYDFFAPTDHNRYYPSEEPNDTFSDITLAFTIIKGEEIHTPENTVHIIHVGGKHSVSDKYIHDTGNYEKELAAYVTKVPAEIPEKYKFRYAQCMWSTEKIHEVGGLAIFPHPYWRMGSSKAFNVCDEFATILLQSGMFDAYELIGCMKQLGNNRSVALWNDLRAEGLKISVVGSSDAHNLENFKEFPHLFTICFAKDRTNDDIIDAVKNRYSVAVEACGTEYERQYRAYGSLRLVSYVHFLLNYFFPLRQRLCQGEGIAMRNYAMDTCGAEVIETQVAVSEDFTACFFGRKTPKLPSQKVKDSITKWREIQLQGPTTKGSSLNGPITRQI